MKETTNAVTLVLRGMNDSAWEIDYFSIIGYEESDGNTLLTLNGHLCNGISFLLIQLSINGFKDIYEGAKADIEEIQKIAFSDLRAIEQRHNYFNVEKSSIKNYVVIRWTYPIQIEFAPDKQLPTEIKNEIREKFQVID